MSEKTTPEDVAKLLSHTHLNEYKVFTQDRRSTSSNLTHISGKAAMHSGDAAKSSAPDASNLDFVRPLPPRWSLLQDFGAEPDPSSLRPDSHELQVPTLAVCSTGGGAGKTTVSATLGRALSLSGDNILMIHGELQPSTPLHFGAQLSQAGRLRSFVPPQRNQGTVHMLSHQFDSGSQDNDDCGRWLVQEVNSLQNEVERCIVEISSPRGPEAQILNLAGISLIVLTPDINSVMALGPFRKLSEAAPRPGARHPGVHFLINKFDPASAFHVEVRQNLRLQLGARLLPFCIRRSDSVAEALAAGMTVLDYAPHSEPSEDFMRLASWARDITTSKRAQGAV